MSSGDLVETIYGKYHKWEIRRKHTTFSTEFNVYRDGKYECFYSSLKAAVEAIKKKDS